MKELAEKINDDLPDKIYSSDLARAKDTTNIVAEKHPNIPVEFTEQLRERDIGEFTGKTKKESGKENEKFLVTSLNTPKQLDNKLVAYATPLAVFLCFVNLALTF